MYVLLSRYVCTGFVMFCWIYWDLFYFVLIYLDLLSSAIYLYSDIAPQVLIINC